MTALAKQQLAAAIKMAKKRTGKNKFKAVKIGYDGHTFDSKAELSRFMLLSKMQDLGQISGLEVHPNFKLCVNGFQVRSYTADFRYTDLSDKNNPKRTVEDVKSPQTANKDGFRIVRKLMWAIYKIEVKVIINGLEEMPLKTGQKKQEGYFLR